MLAPGADHPGFRNAVRHLMVDGVPPDDVVWSFAPVLFAEKLVGEAPPLSLPRAVAQQMRLLVCHSDPERYALLYTLIWRLKHGEPHLSEIHSDPLVQRLHGMERSVRRDLRKMHAFVRFRECAGRFIAWFEPEHFIVEETVQFFVDRFRGLDWAILTPKGSLYWNKTELIVGPPAVKADAPRNDAFEEVWCTYYESIFNPARLNPGAMRQHMAKKYWKNLPEAGSIAGLVRAAPSRVSAMVEQKARMSVKRDPVRAVAAMKDGPRSLAALNRQISAAEPMVEGGARAVLGEGPLHPDIAFVGEQPGDQEDLQGRPFVGPAGQLLDRALAEAGIDRSETYVTNAVKHFKFARRGKKRLHTKPNVGEVKKYRGWLEKELELVQPKLVVALGATALLALTGNVMPVLKNRGPHDLGGHDGYIAVHPSSLLCAPDAQARLAGYAAFVADLRAAKKLAQHRKAA